ncbi:MAG TPA: hypothetical protein VM532_08870 [Burkholderiales bacterium]|jgi:hypothetical protein|nr:hypothetical protein [Burkholderiales bacterium]
MAKADEARRALWETRVATWRRSGLSQGAYAREAGLVRKQLNYWAHCLAAVDQAPTWVPLRIQSANGAPALQVTSANGWRLTLGSETSAAWLSELLRGLA